MDQKRISVVILAKNESFNLKQLLPTLKGFGEVILIDDESTDGSGEYASSLGVKVYVYKLNGDYAAARNFGLSKAAYDWVMFLDADERLEIKKQKTNNKLQITKVDGYAFKREEIFLGRRLRWGELKDQWLVRLGKRSAGEWTGKVHEVWRLNKVIRQQDIAIVHESKKTVGSLFNKVGEYAKLRSRELDNWNIFEQFFLPLGKLFNLLVIKQAYIDGWPGLIMALAMAYHSWLVRFNLIKWDLLMIMWWGLLPMLWLGTWGRFNFGGINFYPHEIWIGMMLIYQLFKGKVINNKLVWVGLLYLSVNGLWGWLAGGSLSGFLYVARFWLLALVAMWLKPPKGYGLVLGLGWVVLGFLQLGLSPDMRWLYELGFDDHLYRMLGTIWDPNYFGIIAVITGIIWYKQSSAYPGKNWLLLVLILAVGLTWSRASYIALIVSGSYLVGKNIIKPALIAGVAALIISGVIKWQVGGEGLNLARTYSLNQRLTNAIEAGQIFASHPLFGVGMNQYSKYVMPRAVINHYNPKAADNLYLWILATTGLVGMGLFVSLVGKWWQRSNSMGRAIILAVLTHSLFNPTLSQALVATLLVVLNRETSKNIIT
jgi:glycosyltransferase involved in cell wall biosynthesis